MEQEIHITLRLDLATGKVNLNEIVYKLKELQSYLMLEILKSILTGYDDVISERLSEPIFSPVRPGRDWAVISEKEMRKAGLVAGEKCGKRVIVAGHDRFLRYLANYICL